jgi:hypothetical protein
MKANRAMNGDVIVRLSAQQALDLATLVGNIGGTTPDDGTLPLREIPARKETTDPLYRVLIAALALPTHSALGVTREVAMLRWRGAKVDQFLNRP